MNELVTLSMRDKIHAIEKEMFKLPQIEIPVRHFFNTGVYAREVFIPAGALVTGVTYKYPQINILSKGRMRVMIEDDIHEIEAPYTVVSDRGIKRIAFAVTVCVWTTILQTHLTDIDAIEKEFFAYSEQEYQDFLKWQA